MSADLLVRKLQNFVSLSAGERAWLHEATTDVRSFQPRQDIIREGDNPQGVHLLVEGWACRYKVMPGGRHALSAYLIPGDLCDIQAMLLEWMDHSIAALSVTPCKVAFMPRASITNMLRRSRALSEALWWNTMVDEAILRELVTSIGHRGVEARLGSLFCEMLIRLKAVGLAEDQTFQLPLTQEALGSLVGTSAVHANRVMQSLRQQGLIETATRGPTRLSELTIKDFERLASLSSFDPAYLHQTAQRVLVPWPGDLR